MCYKKWSFSVHGWRPFLVCIWSASEERNMKLHPLLGHPVSENFVSWCQTLKNSSASFLCIQETYIISNLKVIKKMCTFEVHLCMMYGQLILSGKPFNTFSMARLTYCNCVWSSLPFPISPRILLYKSLLPRMHFFLSPLFPHDMWLEYSS